jgi:hypothetical protein
MKKNTVAVLLSWALMALTITAANASDSLLGIPFGAPLTLNECPRGFDAKVTHPCWIDAPFVYEPTGSSSGWVDLPNQEARPEWAAYATFAITVDKSSVVQEIKVTTSNVRKRYEIANSISRRFGAPFIDQLNRRDLSLARWRSKEGYVDMRCHSQCIIEFRTPSAQAALEADLAARAKRDAARPKAP